MVGLGVGEEWQEGGEKWNRAIGVKGLGEKSVRGLVRELEEKRKEGVGFGGFLFGLGVRGVGEERAREVARSYGEFEEFLQEVKKAAKGSEKRKEGEEQGEAEVKAWERLVGVCGEVVTKEIVHFFSDPNNNQQLSVLLSHLTVLSHPTRGGEEGGEGSEFCVTFTGKLGKVSRGEASKKVKERGGRVFTSLCSHTNVLVVGDKPGKAKVKKAEEMGITIMPEEEWLEIFGGF